MSAETIITRIARRCAVSMDGLRGRKRDTATVCFWIGASQAAYEFGKPEEGEWINRVTTLLIATRGFAEVERIIKAADIEALPKTEGAN